MLPRARVTGVLVLALALQSASARIAFADGAVQNQISVYSGPNAIGYLQPLTNAFGATLNSAFGYSAYIPTSSFHLSIEAPMMGVYFEDPDRTFRAATEAGFQPAQHVTAPTVVGNGDAVTVTGAGGVSYSFPGGLDLNSFALVVPQLRMGSVAGTEALVRWIAFDRGDSDIGTISLFGIGARHSISQFMGEKPLLDIAVGALWQQFKVGKNFTGDDFCTSDALLLQLQAGKRAPVGTVIFEPYASVQWEKLEADITYDDPDGDVVRISTEAQNHWRFTLGAALDFAVGHLFLDYSFSNTDTFALCLAFGSLGHKQTGATTP